MNEVLAMAFLLIALVGAMTVAITTGARKSCVNAPIVTPSYDIVGNCRCVKAIPGGWMITECHDGGCGGK